MASWCWLRPRSISSRVHPSHLASHISHITRGPGRPASSPRSAFALSQDCEAVCLYDTREILPAAVPNPARNPCPPSCARCVSCVSVALRRLCVCILSCGRGYQPDSSLHPSLLRIAISSVWPHVRRLMRVWSREESAAIAGLSLPAPQSPSGTVYSYRKICNYRVPTHTLDEVPRKASH